MACFLVPAAEAVVVTAVWGVAVAVVSAKFKKHAKTAAQEG